MSSGRRRSGAVRTAIGRLRAGSNRAGLIEEITVSADRVVPEGSTLLTIPDDGFARVCPDL